MTQALERSVAAVGIASVDHLLLVLEKAEQVGLSPTSIMRSCGLSYSIQDLRSGNITNIPEADFIRLRQQCIIDIRSKIAPPRYLGMSAQDLDYLIHSLISSLSLREALERQQRFHALTGGRFGRSKLRVDGGMAHFEVSVGPAEGQWAIFFETDALLVYTHLMEWLIGEAFPVEYELAFADDRPNHSIVDIFGVGAALGMERSQINFDAALLDRPVVRTPADLRQFMEYFPWGSPSAAEIVTKVAVRVAALYRHAMLNGAAFPTVAELAGRLGLADATLRRRLKAEGTSIRQIKDELRFEQAAQMLSRADMRMKAVAERSGFRNDKAFIRAFRLKMGETPEEFRRSLKVKD